MSFPRGEPRQMDRPQPGFWLIRLAKGGPRVPACIRHWETTVEPGEPTNLMRGTRYRFLSAEINGEPARMDDVWLRRGEPITKQEHDFRVADAAWARKHAPDEPIANPRKPVDLRTIPLPF